MGHPVILIQNAIITKLIGNEILNPMLGGNVFAIQAPPGTSLPYIEVRYASGGDTNTSPRDDIEVLMQVVGYSSDNDQSGQIAYGIRLALHKQLLDLPGWSNYYAMEDRMIERMKYGADKDPIFQPVYMRGGFYEVRADKLVVNQNS